MCGHVCGLFARHMPLAQMGSAIQPQTSPRRRDAGDPGGVFWIVGSTDHHLLAAHLHSWQRRAVS